MHVNFDAKGRVVLRSVVPGRRIALRLLDPIDQLVVERVVELPAHGQHQQVEVRVDAKESILHGTVMLDGVPVRGAGVTINGTVATWTNDSGVFTMPFYATGARVGIVIDQAEAMTLNAEIQLTPGVQKQRYDLVRRR